MSETKSCHSAQNDNEGEFRRKKKKPQGPAAGALGYKERNCPTLGAGVRTSVKV